MGKAVRLAEGGDVLRRDAHAEGGLLLVGRLAGEETVSEGFALKLDPTGLPVWGRRYVAEGRSTGFDAVTRGPSGYVLGGPWNRSPVPRAPPG